MHARAPPHTHVSTLKNTGMLTRKITRAPSPGGVQEHHGEEQRRRANGRVPHEAAPSHV